MNHPVPKLKAEIERSQRELIEKLGKPKRRLVLQIVDCKDWAAEGLSIDSVNSRLVPTVIMRTPRLHVQQIIIGEEQ